MLVKLFIKTYLKQHYKDFLYKIVCESIQKNSINQSITIYVYRISKSKAICILFYLDSQLLSLRTCVVLIIIFCPFIIILTTMFSFTCVVLIMIFCTFMMYMLSSTFSFTAYCVVLCPFIYILLASYVPLSC